MWKFVAVLLLVALAFTCSFAAETLFDATSGVLSLEPTELETALKSTSPLLVFFYTHRSGKSKTFQPELVKLAKALNGAVQVGALNCLEYNHECEHIYEVGSQDVPVLKLFNGKYNSKRYGGNADVKSIASFVNQALPSNVEAISTMSSSSTQLNRVILFTDKKDIPTLFKSISLEFDGRLETYVARSSESKDKSFIKKYNVESFPILLIENGKTKEITKYDGPVSYPNIRAFVEPHASATKITVSAKNLVKEISDQSCLERLCLQSGAGLCVFAVPSEGNLESDLQVVADIQKQRGQMSKMFSFSSILQSNGNAMNFAKSAFGIQSGLDHPQIVVYSPKKAKFAIYAGAYTTEAINEWLSIVEHGKGRVGNLETPDGKLPTIEGNTQNCPPVVEESADNKKKADKKKKDDVKNKKKDEKKEKPTIREAEPGELDPPPGTHTESSTLYPISSANLEQMVLNSPDAWLLIFADHNDESRQMFGTLMQLARKTKSLVKIGLVDMVMEKTLAEEYDIESGPSIRGFPSGVDKRQIKNIKVYEGSSDAKSLYSYAMSLVVSDIVNVLDGEKAFSDFMAFSASAKKTVPHVLLFRSPSSAPVPPLLAALSHHFPKSIKFAATKSAELKDLFGVNDKNPVIFAINEPTEKNGVFSSEAVRYKGSMGMEELKGWLAQVAKGDVQYKRGRVIEWEKAEADAAAPSSHEEL